MPLPSLLRQSWIWPVMLYLSFAIALQFFPLTSDLHYEFAASCALVVSLTTGLWIVATTRRPPPAPSSMRRGFGGGLPALSFVPLIVPLLLLPFRRSCGLFDGLAWYALLVPASALIGAVLAELSVTLIKRRWAAILLYLSLWSASLVRGAFEAYRGPHIFMYAWQVGFFPGGSWDAELPITPRLIVYRLVHLLVAGALALIVMELRSIQENKTAAPRRTYPSAAIAGLCALLAVACIPYRSELGLTRTHSWLQHELGDSLHTRYTTIYYNRAQADSLDIWRASRLADLYVQEHAELLRLHPEQIEPITLYLYASGTEEKRLVGTSSAAFTKPWLSILNMPLDRVGPTLRHELAHVMFARYGGVLGVSISQGLLEGSAVALENWDERESLHRLARAAYQFNLAPPVEQIMSIGGFSSRRASLAYMLAGSFSAWMIDRYGIKRYQQAYAWGKFDDAYGKSLSQLSKEYEAFIHERDTLPASYRPTIQYLYGGGSFFFQKCLRRIGTLNAEGYDALLEERYDDALRAFNRSIDEGITYSARSGILSALFGMGRFNDLLDSARTYSLDTASYPLLPMLIEQGDANWAIGDTRVARRLYDSALALDMSPTVSLRASLRLIFLSADDSLASIMRLYFTRPMPLMQRLTVLMRASQTTSDTTMRTLLGLMRAVLLKDQFPLTALQEAPPLEQWSSFVGNLARSSDFRMFLAVEALSISLLDAATYSESLRGYHNDWSIEALGSAMWPMWWGVTNVNGIPPLWQAYLKSQQKAAFQLRTFVHKQQPL